MSLDFNYLRHYNTERLTFDVEVLTPMFLGGADMNAELRGASFKGVLRYWWRMLNPGLKADELFEKESRIFGSGGDKDSGKSNVRLWVEADRLEVLNKPMPKVSCGDSSIDQKRRPVDMLKYLAYGVLGGDKEDDRKLSYIEPKQHFTLNIDVGNSNYIQEIKDAMSLLIYFGGLGAKTRNGFGSIGIIDDKALKSRAEALSKTGQNAPVSDYPAFSKDTRLFQIEKKEQSWDKSLCILGNIYRKARLDLESKVYDKRQYIASPVMVDKKNVSDFSRHAKSFHLIVNKPNNGEFISSILYVPSRFMREENDYSNYLKANQEMAQNISTIINNLNRKPNRGYGYHR